jgi:hypothetical protein
LGERSPLSPISAARVMRAQAAALEHTPPRTPASERAGHRLAVHQAVSPQELAAGARASAKRSAQILRLEAEAAARRAAAMELEEVRQTLSKRDAKTSASPRFASTSVQFDYWPVSAGKSKPVDDVVAGSTMAAWASSMRARLADKDDELEQLRAALAAERGNATNNNSRAVQTRPVLAGVQHADALAAQLAAAAQENLQLRSELSASMQECMRLEAQSKVTRQEESLMPKRTTSAEQLEIAHLRQRCETAEQMLSVTEAKAQVDEEA